MLPHKEPREPGDGRNKDDDPMGSQNSLSPPKISKISDNAKSVLADLQAGWLKFSKMFVVIGTL